MIISQPALLLQSCGQEIFRLLSISAISQKRHLELVNEKSDNYDSYPQIKFTFT